MGIRPRWTRRADCSDQNWRNNDCLKRSNSRLQFHGARSRTSSTSSAIAAASTNVAFFGYKQSLQFGPWMVCLAVRDLTFSSASTTWTIFL